MDGLPDNVLRTRWGPPFRRQQEIGRNAFPGPFLPVGVATLCRGRIGRFSAYPTPVRVGRRGKRCTPMRSAITGLYRRSGGIRLRKEIYLVSVNQIRHIYFVVVPIPASDSAHDIQTQSVTRNRGLSPPKRRPSWPPNNSRLPAKSGRNFRG